MSSHAGGGSAARAPRAPRAPRDGERPAVAVLADAFPVVSQTFVAAEALALERRGHRVRIESSARPGADEVGDGMRLAATYLEDDRLPARLRDLAWLVARHPLGCLADLRARRRWRRQEPVLPLRSLASVARRAQAAGDRHLHAHFAAGAALTALRVARLLGISFSVTAHAYDIFREPANLEEKLERAAFSTSGCDYTVKELRRRVAAEHAVRVQRVVMGVDGERFLRGSPYPGGRTVVAVGRLVEKKGFRHLLDAAALLRRRDGLDRLVIVGEGPLGADLRHHAERLGLEGVVEWAGARSQDHVRALLEQADLLVAPCVVASDGDRDSMPVVVKEALAMQVPVVASDEVGLPEVVRDPWGTLAPPGDAGALAEAIDGILSLPAAERARRGRAGRAWVLEHCDVRREAEKVGELIERAVAAQPRTRSSAGLRSPARGRGRARAPGAPGDPHRS